MLSRSFTIPLFFLIGNGSKAFDCLVDQVLFNGPQILSSVVGLICSVKSRLAD